MQVEAEPSSSLHKVESSTMLCDPAEDEDTESDEPPPLEQYSKTIFSLFNSLKLFI